MSIPLPTIIHSIRNIFFGLFVIITFTFCATSKKTESYFIGSYFGKVKTVTTIEYIGTDTSSLTIEHFNTKGKPVRFEFYSNSYASPKSVDEFTYDKRGHKSQTLKIDARGDTTIIKHTTSGSDNVTQLTSADKIHDPNIPKAAKTRISGTIKSRKFSHKSILYLDKKESPIESHYIDDSGRIFEKTVMENDRKGNELSRTRFKQDTVVYSITQTFDRYSNITTSQRIDGTVIRSKTVFRYDYDKQHNWIHRYIIRDHKEVLSEKQIIEYY